MSAITCGSQIADILIVDDTPSVLCLLSSLFEMRGNKVRACCDGEQAWQSVIASLPDIILLDIKLPDMDGFEFCRKLKDNERTADVPVICISGKCEVSDKVRAFEMGAVDYVTKPFQLKEIEARVATHLKIRCLQREITALNLSLQARVDAQVKEISDSQIATIVALAKLSEFRDEATGNHLLRVQRFCQKLAERLAQEGLFDGLIDDAFILNLHHASALHDIGKVGIPDRILLKPGALTPEEFEVMKTHTVLGAETLSAVLASYPNNAFIRMGRDIARSHHERFDGSGYPDGLVGEDIPLCARIVAVADQYDSLRNARPYKPAYDALSTVDVLTKGDGRSKPQDLDPRVLSVFKTMTAEFEAIYQELHD